MVLRNRPRNIIRKPLSRLSLDRLAIMVKPNTAREKYSGAPNDRAKRASGSEKANSTMAPTIPPILDATTEVVRARPGFPCLVNS